MWLSHFYKFIKCVYVTFYLVKTKFLVILGL